MSLEKSTEGNEISIIALDESELRSDELRIVHEKMTVQQLSSNLKSFLNSLDGAMEGLQSTVGGFEINALEVYAEISAEGKISLLGTGAKTGAKGGLKLVLRRSASQAI